MDFDRRRVAHPQQSIVVEVGLLDVPAVHRDLAKECGAQAIQYAALHLCLGSARIHDASAVDGRNDAVHAGTPGRVN